MLLRFLATLCSVPHNAHMLSMTVDVGKHKRSDVETIVLFTH